MAKAIKKVDIEAVRDEPGLPENRLYRFAAFRLKRGYEAVEAELAGVLHPFGLTIRSFTALTMIAENPGLTQAQLVQIMAIDRADVVAITVDLEASGFIIRDPLSKNRRAFALTATLSGGRLAELAQKAVTTHDGRLLAGISDDDQAAHRRVLDKFAGV